MSPMLIAEQSESAMRCERCHGIMMNGSSRTVLDDSGSLAITAWRCSSCDGVIEEIQVLSRYGAAQLRRARYIVRPQRSTRRLARFPQDEFRN